jgi:tRNA A37 methylthiotransferase MiaB
MIYYHIVTLGCQMNKSDSERVATVIGQMGYQWTDREEDADLLGIIACSVRQKAIDKFIHEFLNGIAGKIKKASSPSLPVVFSPRIVRNF